MVLEYCKNGSLESYLLKNKQKFQNQVSHGTFVEECELLVGNQFAPLQLLNWTSDIAKAVEFIHCKRVIHGDLASRNILLTSNLTAKVGDFGLSRQLVGTSCYTKKTRCPLPWRNMAIESLKQMQFSVKSDIWALGITLWEIYTLGDKPYVGMRYNSDFIKLLQGGMRPPKPNNIEERLYEFMLKCWDAVPGNRPSVTKLKDICDVIRRGDVNT
ncbi:Tyrosine-protein kinase receptor Tie-1 [Orchesella cincta]|uniref:Tyrosine-protein kinase receptor Tie-1 n=1 Tax=Orchesella cincta TaxID=48709 RepID=A0A1D2MPW1_ORCCI|nr:Tyrosine-protein kinase receptor Tie-1 [Orchesella cincta]